MSAERIVITGMGCVTPLGLNLEATWDGLLRGRSAVGPIRRFDPTGFLTTFGAELTGFTPPTLSGRFSRWRDDKGDYALAAAIEAMGQAGLLDAAMDPYRLGVSVGAEVSRPGLGVLAERAAVIQSQGAATAYHQTPPRDFVVMSAAFPASLLAAYFNARGPNLTTSTACTSSAQAIGDAARALRRGEAEVMLTGGADRLVEELMVLGFNLLGALSTRNDEPHRASRPFDRTRDGFVLGEGAGMLVLETLSHARARGATILAELLGFGASANAWRITDSPADGRGARASMLAALEDAGLAPEDVDYINAHGTSTQQNDASETAGIHGAFGAHALKLPVSSTKSMMGHLVAACGAVELIACVQTLRHGVIPPTINYEHRDPICDLDYVPNEARPARVDVALSNAFGFGGSNGSLLVGRF
ncbi:beta-ketoacyl-[acyl-carrier-protein] synthase family protein [Myxococcota bacterium]|nr:beta-ketoacyl-[acyl-carrier-protein] synthase family protein [Myxococcota bacterium]MBU1430884.1 beta-ketoacyl-[acyl-carrier-protein] synthase family protein [Myxococcota bacterium]MBU1900174.1 beta-ketoacyl-[acyl-carrier-protein] synthase family protein [Myxococcota bacterium]